MERNGAPGGVGHLTLGAVVRQESVVEHEPSLLVALDVVGPFEEPPADLGGRGGRRVGGRHGGSGGRGGVTLCRGRGGRRARMEKVRGIFH